MIQNESIITIADNSGVKKALVIRCLGGSNRKFSSVGDIVVCSAKQTISNSPIKKGKVIKVLIIRTKRTIQRDSNISIKFSENAGVLLKEDMVSPVGTRIFGPVAREVKNKKFNKIISLSKEVL